MTGTESGNRDESGQPPVWNRIRGVSEKSSAANRSRHRLTFRTSTTHAGPTKTSSGSRSTVAPALSKWNGASQCVAVWTLVSTEPTLTLAPAAIDQPRRNLNGTSPGQHAVPSASGREMSISSGDAGIVIWELVVGVGAQDLFEDVDRADAFGKRRVKRGRAKSQEVGRAEVRNHSTGSKGAREL